MNNPLLRFGANAGPAPVNIAPAQPLGFGDTIRQFSSGPAAPGSFSVPTGNRPASGIPTTAGDFASSTPSGITVPKSVFGEVNSALNVDSNGNPLEKGGLFGDFFGKDGFGIGDLGELSKIIGGFGNLWMGMQANKLAKKSLDFEKQAYDTNLSNQISSYNLALEDRMRARYAQNGRSQSEATAKIEQNKL
jgi:hypothetical protein